MASFVHTFAVTHIHARKTGRMVLRVTAPRPSPWPISRQSPPLKMPGIPTVRCCRQSACACYRIHNSHAQARARAGRSPTYPQAQRAHAAAAAHAHARRSRTLIHVHAHAHTHAYGCAYACTRMCTCISTLTRERASPRSHIHPCTRMCTCISTLTRERTSSRSHIHPCTRAHPLVLMPLTAAMGPAYANVTVLGGATQPTVDVTGVDGAVHGMTQAFAGLQDKTAQTQPLLTASDLTLLLQDAFPTGNAGAAFRCSDTNASQVRGWFGFYPWWGRWFACVLGSCEL